MCHATGLVLAQVASDKGAAQSELRVAAQLLGQLKGEGRVLSGDAIFCQKNLCKQVGEAGGDYLFRVKAKQGHLHSELEILFDLTLLAAGLAFDLRRVVQVDKGQARVEVRRATAAVELAASANGP